MKNEKEKPKVNIEALEHAVNAGDAEAMLAIGICYDQGLYVEKNEEKAFEWFGKAGNAGNARAMFNLGGCYRQGRGVEKNEEKAFEWFKKAAEADYAGAMFDLGLCCHQGLGVEKNEEKAFYWFRKAAEAGYVRSMFVLGIYYQYGFGVDENPKKAFKWFEKGAEEGEEYAMFDLGDCYRQGLGVDKNFKQAFFWWKKAAEKGHERAEYYCYLIDLAGEDEEVFDKLFEVVDIRNDIMDKLHQKVEGKEEKIYHYTNIHVLNAVLTPPSEKNKAEGRLWMSHSMHLNDPMEGKHFYNWLNKKLKYENEDYPLLDEDGREEFQRIIDLLIPDNTYQKKQDWAVFLTSFAKEKDNLNMWRLYGDDGKGASLGLSHKLFKDKINSWKTVSKKADKDENIPLILYKVSYSLGEEENIKQDLQKLMEALAKVIKAYEDGEIKEDIITRIPTLLGELPYLFKDEAYKSENEVRMITSLPYSDKRIKISKTDEGNHRLYVETAPLLFEAGGMDIMLGPIVDKPHMKIPFIRQQMVKRKMKGLLEKSVKPYQK